MGGRIGKAQALLGGVLQFNPIVGIRDGETHPADRPRTRRRAQRRIIELVRELAPIHQLHLSYSTGPNNALTIRDELADLVAPERLFESRFGPVLGTRLGPNTVLLVDAKRGELHFAPEATFSLRSRKTYDSLADAEANAVAGGGRA